jgi:hypothetical protein
MDVDELHAQEIGPVDPVVPVAAAERAAGG